MCAINGVTANDHALVERMNKRTKHRGPDGSRVWEGEGITLGHNRLAIIDLSNRALQPMHSTDGRYAIVFNGEIYNYRELRKELLSSYQFKTESDTEVLIAAYHLWGEAMLPRLRGMFALGLWDAQAKSLLLVRDHMGVKPLYYKHENGVLSFSSELRAFQGEGSAVLDTRALSLFLELQYVPSPYTLVKGIEKLRPGHLLRFKGGVAVVERYYAPENNVGIPKEYQGEKAGTPEELYQAIDNAVERQLVSERPVGMFLSGGLDSSIVLHHMSKHTHHTRTFSVSFEMVQGSEPESDKFNADARLAEKTARHYGAEHRTFRLPISFVHENLEHVLSSLDEPVANPTALSQYFLGKHVREDGVVVALGGDGGDELFLGYTRHRMLMAAHLFQHMPEFAQHAFGMLHPRIQKLRTPQGAPLHMSVMANKEKDVRGTVPRLTDLQQVVLNLLETRYAEIKHRMHPLERFMYVDRTTWLPDESLHRTDRAGMIHGLELRVPLLDLEVVTLADRIPVTHKLSPFEGKKVLRNLYREHLPPYLFQQPKRGWISPGAKWLRDPHVLAQVRSILSPQYYDGLKGFDWTYIQELLSLHVEKRTYALYPLWNILALQVWARSKGVTTEIL